MIDLTIVILTKNEEKNLPKCILSFGDIPSRFVVVDSYSTDGTLEVCEQMRVELAEKGIVLDIFQHPFVSHADQFNWALDNANITTSWTMRIDADEELTEGLAGEFQEMLPSLPESVKGINLRRRVYFMGKWIRHGGCYPVILLRVFRTGCAHCENSLMDEHIDLDEPGELVTFRNDFSDYNTKSLEWWIAKHNRYSNLEVLEHTARVDSPNGAILSGQARLKRIAKDRGYYRLPSFTRAHLYFVYRYYFRLGFLDGTEGKIFHFLQAYWYRFLVDAKLFEQDSTSLK